MSRGSFYFAIACSVVYLLVTVVETTMYQLRMHNLERQRVMESEIATAQRTNALAQQLVQRMSIDSVHDPALTELLRHYGVRVVLSTPGAGTTPAANPSTPANPVPTAPDTNAGGAMHP